MPISTITVADFNGAALRVTNSNIGNASTYFVLFKPVDINSELYMPRYVEQSLIPDNKYFVLDKDDNDEFIANWNNSSEFELTPCLMVLKFDSHGSFVGVANDILRVNF